MVEIDESLIGYVRVSSEEQNYDLQKDAMLAAGVHPELICQDIESGWAPKKERVGLRNALRYCQRGATLVVWKLDRLGRNTIELLMTLHRLDERGVKFRSLTQPHLNTENADSATGRFIVALHAALAQLESDQISERTKAGMRSAKARGVRFGRKTFAELFVDTGKVAEYRKLRRDGVPVKAALKEIEMPRSTYKKYQEIIEPPPPVDDIGDGLDEA